MTFQINRSSVLTIVGAALLMAHCGVADTGNGSDSDELNRGGKGVSVGSGKRNKQWIDKSSDDPTVGDPLLAEPLHPAYEDLEVWCDSDEGPEKQTIRFDLSQATNSLDRSRVTICLADYQAQTEYCDGVDLYSKDEILYDDQFINATGEGKFGYGIEILVLDSNNDGMVERFQGTLDIFHGAPNGGPASDRCYFIAFNTK